MNTISLCGNDWKLIYVKNDRLNVDGITADLTVLRERGYEEIPASVPGNLEIDLENNGIIEDPFFADNHHKRDCEYLHSFYTKTFTYDGSLENPSLFFEGIDTVADIYLNGTFLANTDNMLISHEIEVGEALNVGENILTVHIKPAVIEARKYPMVLNDYADKFNNPSLYIRKAPHMYSWDIMPRLVSAGIWKPVYLKERKKDRIVDFYCYTVVVDREKNLGVMNFLYNTQLSGDECHFYKLKVDGKCEESEFHYETNLYHTSGRGTIRVNEPKLWWPRFTGEQPLYTVTVTLEKDGELLDEYATRIGIRTVELDRTSTTNAAGDGEFCFKVNGKRIFCMGTNWVPADALHSRDAERIPEILPMITDINCNIIRLWGGNVYENDALYDFCDENGILIWQDFIMGCAIYPQDEEFQKRLRTEATSVVKRLRQHPSIILWAGDNENDIVYNQGWGSRGSRDPGKNVLTRKVLPEVIDHHDYGRPYLPSSPYIDETAFKTKAPPAEAHLWGPRDYFKGAYYGNSVCHFASETGYHGCTSPVSIKKFIPEEYLWTSKNSENWEAFENSMWIAHAASLESTPSGHYASRIRLMGNQVTTLFGNTVPNTLADFAKASQISQAEAKKYFIERFRVTKWRRTGIIWWNLIDGWPQFSDAVVDYYYVKKLAYQYIKRSQNPICLMFDEPKENVLTLHAVNEFTRDYSLSYTVTDLTTGKTVVAGEAVAKAESSRPICHVEIAEGEKHFYFIEWKIDGKTYSNHYMTNIKDIDYAEYLGYIEKCGYAQFEGFEA